MSWLRRERPKASAPVAPLVPVTAAPTIVFTVAPPLPHHSNRAIVVLASPCGKEVKSDASTSVASAAVPVVAASSITICTLVASFLDIATICSLSRVSLHLRRLSNDDSIWKEPACNRWTELKLATKVGNDPWPAWKSCYVRKAAVKETGLNEIMDELGYCDWYTCPNGHLYVIGECRLPMSMGRCPQCGVRIGGEHHTMLRDNRRVGAVANGNLREKKIGFDDIQEQLSSKPSTWVANWTWEAHQKERRKQGHTDEEDCCVCHHRKVDVILMPCRHAIVCDDCLVNIRDRSNKCPSCSARIEKVIRAPAPVATAPPTSVADAASPATAT